MLEVDLCKGDAVENPHAWVVGIARHKLLDHYRRQSGSERVVHLDSGGDGDPATRCVGRG